MLVAEGEKKKPCRWCAHWRASDTWGRCLKRKKNVWRFPNETCGKWEKK